MILTGYVNAPTNPSPGVASSPVRAAGEATRRDTTSHLTTFEVVCDAIDMLNDGNVILGSGEVDYAAAGMLQVLVDLHREAALDLDAGMDELHEFARLVIEGWPL